MNQQWQADFDRKWFETSPSRDWAKWEAIRDSLLDPDVTLKEVARLHGVSVKTVQNVQSHYKLKRSRKSGHNRIPDDRRQAILEDIAESGMTLEQIALRYGVSVSSLYNFKRGAGIERTPQQTIKDGPNVSPEVKRQIIIDLLGGTMTNAEIALAYGVSTSTVARLRTYAVESDRAETEPPIYTGNLILQLERIEHARAIHGLRF